MISGAVSASGDVQVGTSFDLAVSTLTVSGATSASGDVQITNAILLDVSASPIALTGSASTTGNLGVGVNLSASAIAVSGAIGSLVTALGSGSVNVTLYPGCDRSRSRCVARFNNLARKGSFPFIPIRNPFDGSSIA